VAGTHDVRLIVDGSEIGIGVAKCVGRALQSGACWTVYKPLPSYVILNEARAMTKMLITNEAGPAVAETRCLRN
jgi:hypothetical protein